MSKNLSELFPPGGGVSGGDVDWGDIVGIPAEFPPEPHGHEIDDVNGLQDALDKPSVHVGDTPPAGPEEGQMWLNTDDGYLYVYYSNAGSPTWMAVEREQ